MSQPTAARIVAALVLVGAVCTAGAAMPARAASGHKPSVFTQATIAASSRERRGALAAARNWGYQLRIRNLAPLAASTTDLLVIDHGYTARKDGKTTFEPDEVAALKRRPDGRRRIVLSYLSIGEAEQYRYYWQGDWCKRATAPAWIGAVNPNWPGNYPVRFWDPEWQKLVLDPTDGYLARIKAQGFDGVYLDRTDVYSEWAAENPHAEADMIAFLSAIAEAARKDNPHFMIVMQNAEELLERPAVRNLLDAVAKEDLLYGLNYTQDPNPPKEVTDSIAELRRARAVGMPVFAVEYLADPVKMAGARQRLLDLGYVPTFGPRLLDALPAELVTPAGPGVASPSVVPAPAPAVSSTPSASWAEGAPTCLLD